MRSITTHFHRHTVKLRLPKRILLVRHGESLGNVNEEAYQCIPDWLIPITDCGQQQAQNMGKKIKDIIKDEPIFIYYSPYLRTRQTMISMMEELQDNPIYGIREEPRITEQQFGNFQNKQMEIYKREKLHFGRFYYRFPNGESGLDVYNRVTSFIGSLFREWYSHVDDEDFSNVNVIIVTHGLSLRLFIMRWFHFTLHQFEQSTNPGNGAIIIMNRQSKGKGKLENPNDIDNQLKSGISSGTSIPKRTVSYESFANTEGDAEYLELSEESQRLLNLHIHQSSLSDMEDDTCIMVEDEFEPTQIDPGPSNVASLTTNSIRYLEEVKNIPRKIAYWNNHSIKSELKSEISSDLENTEYIIRQKKGPENDTNEAAPTSPKTTHQQENIRSNLSPPVEYVSMKTALFVASISSNVALLIYIFRYLHNNS